MAQDTGKNVIANSYSAVIETLRNIFLAFRKNIVLLLTCIAITIGLLFLYNSSRSGTYKASFTVAYDDLVRKIYGDRLYKINLLVQRGEFNKVAFYLGVDKRVASTLKSVKGKNILGEDLTQDMNTDRIPFIIKIEVSDSSSIPKLQAGLVNFLEEGNAYSATSKALKIKEIDEELQFIEGQMEMMDSLKRKYNAETATSDDKENSLTTIYNFSYELYKKKKELLRKKSMPGTIQIIDDAIVAQDAGVPAAVIVILGIIVGTGLFAVIVLFIKPALRT